MEEGRRHLYAVLPSGGDEVPLLLRELCDDVTWGDGKRTKKGRKRDEKGTKKGRKREVKGRKKIGVREEWGRSKGMIAKEWGREGEGIEKG